MLAMAISRSRFSSCFTVSGRLILLQLVTLKAAESTQSSANRVTFYFLDGFTGSTDIFNLQPGCHDLAVYFRSNIASLDTGGNCIRVFSGLGCTGESTEFSGAHNELDDWSDQIESWRGCAFSSGGTYSVSQERRVTFYCIPNFSGSRRIAPFTSGCEELVDSDITFGNAESLDTGGTCIIAFSNVRCTGESKQFSGLFSSLGTWNDKIASWKGCPDQLEIDVSEEPVTTSAEVETTETIESEVTVFEANIGSQPRGGGAIIFYQLRGYRGSKSTMSYSPACHDLPGYMRSDSRSLHTGGNCIIAYSNIGCTGSYRRFDGIYDDLLAWNDIIDSWASCSNSNPTTTTTTSTPTTTTETATTSAPEQEEEISFFIMADFSGPMHTGKITPGCHVLPHGFRTNTLSLKTDNNSCVRVFSHVGCSGRVKEFSGLHANLEEWNDRIESWGKCLTSDIRESLQHGEIAFFVMKDFGGSAHVDDDATGCHELPEEFRAKAQSLKAFDSCIRVFSEEECAGNRKDFFGNHADLDEWSDMIKSWEVCSNPEKVTLLPDSVGHTAAAVQQKTLSTSEYFDCTESDKSCSSSQSLPRLNIFTMLIQMKLTSIFIL